MENFETLYYQLTLAYYQARSNKRNTQNQIAFELNFEQNLYALTTHIANRAYTPKSSIAFIVNKPVQREIFAADFTDRVVHHLLYNCIYHTIDKKLINDTYSCRKGKGTLYGINRVKKFIRSCSLNYTTDAYILKLDIKGYFMSINQQLIYDKMISFIDEEKNYKGISASTLMYLLEQTVFNNVAKNCTIKGKLTDWNGLPLDKSLFNKPLGVGLPIGNLTSQIFGNIYLNDLDHYIKHILSIKYYGRYVDDMVFIHHDKEYLKSIIPLLQQKLAPIGLLLHPKKIYLQHYTAGLLFLGQYIKPYRTYISNRTKNNFYKAIKTINSLLVQTEAIPWVVIKKIQTILNSYLGILNHANAFNVTKKAISGLIKRFYNFFGFTKAFAKVYIKKEFWLWHYTQTYLFTN